VSEEEIDVVDHDDRVVGTSTVRECLERALLHRAVATLVLRRGGRFVLQQRSRGDRWHPGLWTLSSTGHVKAGETYASAAKRELEEELGIRGTLHKVGKYLLPPISDGGLTEREWVTLFTCRSNSRLTIDPVELEGAEDFDRTRAAEMIDVGLLTPDAVFLLGECFQRLPS